MTAIYICSSIAAKELPNGRTTYRYMADIYAAASHAEALGKGLAGARNAAPAADGYGGHAVEVKQLSVEFLRELLAEVEK